MIITSLADISLDQLRPAVDARLGRLLDDKSRQAALLDPSYGRLWETMRATLFHGGKRLRPYLTILGYEAAGGSDLAIIDIACAQELLHFALLVHDDIIDRDDIRHGQPNVAGVYAQYYTGHDDATHFAGGAALLAGDLALSLAHELIMTSGFSADRREIAHSFLTQAVFEVAGGELIDMELPMRSSDARHYLKVARYKTAGYTFINPLLTGAAMADAPEDLVESFRSYGISVGTAYQLADDLLGVYGDPAKTGKSVTSDMREGKKTYLYCESYRRSTALQRRVLDAHWGNHASGDAELELVKEIFSLSGGRAATEKCIDGYVDAAAVALAKATMPVGVRDKLSHLMSQATERAV